MLFVLRKIYMTVRLAPVGKTRLLWEIDTANITIILWAG